jgi:uncharacterized protein YcfL
MKKILFIMLLAIGLTSCESHTGRTRANRGDTVQTQSFKTNNVPEKVVILIVSDYDMQEKVYKYKVKRISAGVSDFIKHRECFAAGDTILYHFN